MIHTNSKNLN